MRLLLFICLFLIHSACTVNTVGTGTYTFRFGVNEGRVSFTVDGSMGIFEKTKKVPVVVPECSTLKYVQVDIYNPLGPPLVTFDWSMNTVEITYGLLQPSLSKYTVVAKTVKSPFCSGIQNNLPEYLPVLI